MPSEPLFYATGEEIHLGDRVQYRGTYATVVVISDGETSEMAPGYEDEVGAQHGVIVCDDDGARNSLHEGNDELVFMNR